MFNLRPRTLALGSFIAVDAASRLVPHPPNFTPILSMALFAGAKFPKWRTALFVSVLSMFLSDLALGLHWLMPFTYGCVALTVWLGRTALRREWNWQVVLVVNLAAVALFYLVTNFGVWLFSVFLYPKTCAGLIACYAAALPFALNQLLGTAFFSALLFGGLRAAEWRWPLLRSTPATA